MSLGDELPSRFFAGEGGLQFLGGILRSRTISGLAECQQQFRGQKKGRVVQHGDLIETCALRMCLLDMLLDLMWLLLEASKLTTS